MRLDFGFWILDLFLFGTVFLNWILNFELDFVNFDWIGFLYWILNFGLDFVSFFWIDLFDTA